MLSKSPPSEPILVAKHSNRYTVEATSWSAMKTSTLVTLSRLVVVTSYRSGLSLSTVVSVTLGAGSPVATQVAETDWSETRCVNRVCAWERGGREMETDRQTEKETERQRETETERQRQTDRQR